MKRCSVANRLALAPAALAIFAFAAAASAEPIADLTAAAKKEGQLNVIALPRDWCGYGGIIDGFEAKYGITVNEARPEAASEDQIEAIKAGIWAGTERPDVIDIGISFAPQAKRDGLLQPYKVSTWDTIPDAVKDADGHWYGDYYGVLVFEINADLVKSLPQDWADLARPEYRGSIALAGNLSSNQALLGVYAAGLSVTDRNVEEAARQGLEFFAELNRSGNFLPVIGNTDSLVEGRTPILIRWEYLALADRDQFGGKTRIEIVRPRTGVVAGVYAQAISAFAPHPNAARLWMEHLYSDATQIAWLRDHCEPIRLQDLASRGVVPVDWQKKLPLERDGAASDPAFPSIEEQERAREVIIKGWDAIVGVAIECVPPEPDLGPMSFNTIGTCQTPIPQ
ncbi:putative solute-binding component of ABC transporter [Sinorhizobium fredii NGR234]|uniref:Solute-binding component of ABC transporter n=1 Tax=Sinorhizobium fredii (strain NBRC 101917 / NGR234) TaxID=394 RepID=C3ME63_SINFN|nr:ABC transporter substrate-binding protein [Sinorhizobium fredii]ACP25732.1 putative solute-binding component of ABC transporter [Sinorhizobium fredii NGR234]